MTPIKGFAVRKRAGDDASENTEVPDGGEARREAGQLRLVDTSIDPATEAGPRRALRRTPRRWTVTGGAEESEQSRDRALAGDLVKLVQDLNRAMDEAKRNGLIVEPNLSTITSQYGGDGDAGHLLSVKIFRKLT